MDIIDKLQELATEREWFWNYGRMEWQNLIDLSDDTDKPFDDKQKCLLGLWHDTEDVLNEYGGFEGENIKGGVILCVRSAIYDKDQNVKYEKHVKGLKALLRSLRSDINDCDYFRVKSWKMVEVYDNLDTNLDGMKVTYNIYNYGATIPK